MTRLLQTLKKRDGKKSKGEGGEAPKPSFKKQPEQNLRFDVYTFLCKITLVCALLLYSAITN